MDATGRQGTTLQKNKSTSSFRSVAPCLQRSRRHHSHSARSPSFTQARQDRRESLSHLALLPLLQDLMLILAFLALSAQVCFSVPRSEFRAQRSSLHAPNSAFMEPSAFPLLDFPLVSRHSSLVTAYQKEKPQPTISRPGLPACFPMKSHQGSTSIGTRIVFPPPYTTHTLYRPGASFAVSIPNQ